jgi:hypothetical protein
VREQHAVELADQPVRNRESFADTLESMFQCCYITGHFDDVVHWHTGSLVEFEQQQVRKRGLCALDLGGKHGLLANVRVEKQMGVRKQR